MHSLLSGLESEASSHLEADLLIQWCPEYYKTALLISYLTEYIIANPTFWGYLVKSACETSEINPDKRLLFLLVYFCILTIPKDKLLTSKGNLKSNLHLLLPFLSVLFRGREQPPRGIS